MDAGISDLNKLFDSGIYSKTHKTGMTVLIGIAEYSYNRQQQMQY